MIFRRATESDIETIRSLESEAFGFTWEVDTFRKELVRENGVTAVADKGGVVQAAALLVWAVDEVQLNSLVVPPELRGRGIARNFLGFLMGWLGEENFSWITLEVKWNNEPALKLYRRLGFVTTARRRAYYRDGQDARLMWAGHLQAPAFQKILEPFAGDRSQLRSAS